MDPPSAQLWDGTSSQIGATATGTDTTSSANTDTFTFTGVTYSQLATLRVRIYANGGTATAGATQSVDYAALTVAYMPKNPGVSTTVSPAVLAIATAQPAVTVSPRNANPAPATLAVATAQPQAAAAIGFVPVGTPAGGPYTFAWGDEFNDPAGTGLPDPAVWIDHFLEGDAYRCNDNGTEIEWFPHNKAGLSVTGGSLILTARHESPYSGVSAGYDPLCPNPMRNGQAAAYTSGMVLSKPGFAFTYGYVEARMKVPAAVGSWPAFWTYGANTNWPPEFDICETHGGYTSFTTVYWDTGGPNVANPSFDRTQWNVFGCAWLPGGTYFYLNGVQVFSWTGGATMSAAEDIVLEVAVDTTATGTGFPDTLQVDYVRAWTFTGVPAQPVITSVSPSSGVPAAGSVTVNFGAVSGATSYRVTVCPLDGDADGWVGADNTATGSSSPIAVSGLQAGVRYTFSVAAINATGYSIESAPVPPMVGEPVLPATLAVATSQPAAAVTAGTGTAAAPAVVAVTTAQPAPVVRQDRTITVTALTVTTSAPAPVVRQDRTITPAVLTVASAQPAPAILVAALPATLAVTTTQPVPAAGTAVTPVGNPAGGPWVLAWQDEFTDPYGTGQPDWTVWADHLINGDAWRSNDAGNEIDWATHDHRGTTVSGGILSLTAASQGSHANLAAIDPLVPATLPGGQAPTYSTGMIQSHPGFQFTYGYFETRCRFPSVTGSWPGPWFVTADTNWGPEVDLAEYGSRGGLNDWHAGYYSTAGVWQNNYTTETDSANFHVYGVRIDSSHVTFYFDGAQVFQATIDSNVFPWVPNFVHMVTTSATGTGYPCSLDVDYARAWTVAGVPGQPVITSVTPSNGKPTGGTLQVAFSTPSGTPTNYRATICPVDVHRDLSDSFTRHVTSGSASPLTVSGLTNGVPYTVTVGASNATGWGIESLPAPAGLLNANALALPATLAVATSQPAAAVTTSTGATVSAATLAVTTAQPAATVTVTSNATAAPATLTVTTTRPAATVSPGPATLAVATAQPAVTVTTASNATATPAVVAVTTAQPAATVSAGTGTTAAPATVAVATTAPLPVVRQDQNPAPAVKAVTTTIPAPAVTAGGSATTAPATLAVTTAQPAPVVRQDQAVTVTGLAAATTAPVPAVTTASNATAAPGAVAIATAQPGVTVTTSTGATVTPATLMATAAFPQSAASAGGSATAAPAAVVIAAAISVPQVRQDRTLIPAVLAVTVTIPAPAASGNASLAPATLTVLAAFPARTVSTGMTAAPSVVAVTVDIPQVTRPATFGTALATGTPLTTAMPSGAALITATASSSGTPIAIAGGQP